MKQMLLQAHFYTVLSFSLQATRKTTQGESFLSVGSVDWGDKNLISYKVTTESDMSYRPRIQCHLFSQEISKLLGKNL